MEFEVKIPGEALVTGEVDERGKKGGDGDKLVWSMYLFI